MFHCDRRAITPSGRRRPAARRLRSWRHVDSAAGNGRKASFWFGGAVVRIARPHPQIERTENRSMTSDSSRSLTGSHVVVMGGSAGIGLGAAAAFLESGAV